MAEQSTIITPEDAMKDREYRAKEAEARDAEAIEERDNAERAIVGAIVALAVKYNALDDLKKVGDITIPNLKALAESKEVSLTDWNALISSITPMVWQLEAVVGGTWADCWQGLKSRFAQWMEEINDNGGNQ